MARFFRSFFSPSEQEGRVYDDKNRTGVMYKSAYNRIQDARIIAAKFSVMENVRFSRIVVIILLARRRR